MKYTPMRNDKIVAKCRVRVDKKGRRRSFVLLSLAFFTCLDPENCGSGGSPVFDQRRKSPSHHATRFIATASSLDLSVVSAYNLTRASVTLGTSSQVCQVQPQQPAPGLSLGLAPHHLCRLPSPTTIQQDDEQQEAPEGYSSPNFFV